MAVLITGAGMVGSLAAARLIADYQEQPVLYDVGFSLDKDRAFARVLESRHWRYINGLKKVWCWPIATPPQHLLDFGTSRRRLSGKYRRDYKSCK